jgi:tetratricopeptide (TPR) repeat protein
MALAACSRPPENSLQRIALLPFANLTGDASLDWMASQAPAIVASQISDSATIVPLRAETVSDAYRARATRFLHGYYTLRGNRLQFEIEIEDAARHQMVKNTFVEGGLLDAMNAVSKSLYPAAHAFSTSNPEAVAAWGRRDYEHAVALDPDFGAAWLLWVQTLAAQGNAARASEVTAMALARPALRTPVDRAEIELMSAALRKDSTARTNTLVALARLAPADTSWQEALAQDALNARRFSAAVEPYRNLLRLDPENPVHRNTLGYVEAYMGDVDAALQTFEEYGRQPGQKTNSLDSTGEAYFLNGRFADAEKFFMQAYQADPAFTGGAELEKAAYARWLGGDLKGADALMERYLMYRSGLRDGLLAWRQAAWEYATGRRDQAIQKLASAPPSEKELVERQTAVWRGDVKIPSDLSALKDQYDRTSPTADSQVRTFYASALLAAGRKEQARALLKLWPLPDSPGDPLLQSLVFPKFLEARHATGLQ